MKKFFHGREDLGETRGGAQAVMQAKPPRLLAIHLLLCGVWPGTRPCTCTGTSLQPGGWGPLHWHTKQHTLSCHDQKETL